MLRIPHISRKRRIAVTRFRLLQLINMFVARQSFIEIVSSFSYITLMMIYVAKYYTFYYHLENVSYANMLLIV